MISFSTLKYKNFLSIGNKFTEYSFENDTKTLISGKNGTSKSAMADALCFALFGKAFRKIRKDQLINSINQKDLQVELEFCIGNVSYLIRRGIKPNYFEIYVNGVLKTQDASVNDYQEYLEKTILGMTEKTFRQIIVLGSSAYIPFMNLPAWHRRVIVEDLLCVEIFSKMYNVLRSKVSINKDNLNVLESQIKLIEKSIDMTNESIDRFSVNNDSTIESNRAQILKLNDELEKQIKIIEDLSDLKSSSADALNLLKDSINIESEKKNKLHSYIVSFETKRNRFNEENNFYQNNDKCQACHQPIDDDFKNKKINENTNEIQKLNDNILLAKEKKNISTLKIEELISENDRLKSKLSEVTLALSNKRSIEQQKKNLESINKKLSENSKSEVNSLKKKLKEYKIELNSIQHNISISEKTIGELQYIAELLKDDGIKSKIIKHYIPLINNMIKKYLNILNFNINFTFDEAFNETILSRYRDNFSYENFSEGEKQRIDLALLFTWRELARVKNSAATNLIILDEVGDAVLDDEGFEGFFDILNDSMQNKCVMIISHRPDKIISKVDYSIECIKNGNFTELKKTKMTQACLD